MYLGVSFVVAIMVVIIIHYIIILYIIHYIRNVCLQQSSCEPGPNPV